MSFDNYKYVLIFSFSHFYTINDCVTTKYKLLSLYNGNL